MTARAAGGRYNRGGGFLYGRADEWIGEWDGYLFRR